MRTNVLYQMLKNSSVLLLHFTKGYQFVTKRPHIKTKAVPANAETRVVISV
ncbi:hypothetical protein JCM19039_1948 [Geomicrobium sp. JCM 19039]|nr:hypothetical protein JCM19039_1948 [Geomicrobium sp. JCM 19039]